MVTLHHACRVGKLMQCPQHVVQLFNKRAFNFAQDTNLRLQQGGGGACVTGPVLLT